MVNHTKAPNSVTGRNYWLSLLTGRSLPPKVLLLTMVFIVANSFDRRVPPVGGDFSLDFVAAAPYTYNHTTGGGAYDDRTIGKTADVVESLEGGDFTCGDIVTFFTQITVDDGAVGSQTIELDYSFLADATGQSGVALADITNVEINYGAVEGGDGPGSTDSGIDDDGGSTATLSNEHITGSGELFDGNELRGTVTVTDLEAGETVVVRVDVRIACDPGSSPTGNLQADITAGRVTAPADQAGTIPVGNQTIPFKNVNEIVFPTCAITPSAPVCTGTTNTYTATSDVPDASFTWSLSGNGTFTSGTNPQTITATGGATSTSVSVLAGAPGSYTLTVSISKTGFGTQTCSTTVTVNPLPDVDAGAAQTLTCTTQSIQLQGSSTTAGVTFSWTGPNGFTSNVANPTVSTPGTYTLTVTDPATGCSATDQVIIGQNITPPANVDAGAAQTLTCTTQSVQLQGSSTTAGVTFSWSGPNGFTSNVANPTVTAPGTYTVTVTDPVNGCTATDQVIIGQDIALPENVDAGAAQTLTCTTQSVQLNGSSTTAGVTFSWTGPNGFTSNIANPTVTVPGTYTLTVTNPVNGCTATDQVIIGQAIDAPNVDAGAAQTLTCVIESVQLNGSSTTTGATFSWTGPNGFTSNLEDPTVTEPGTYTLTMSDPSNGCTATDQVTIGENITPPNISATGGAITCLVLSVQLNGSSTTPNATFSWTGPNGFTSNLEDPTVSVPGTYTLTVTDPANGCTATATAEVVVNQNAPIPGGVTVDQPDCEQQYGTITVTSTQTSVTFTLTGPNNYSESNTSGVFENLLPGTYFVSISSNVGVPGCTSNIPTGYIVEEQPGCGEGCTPGYWKTHPEAWAGCYSTDASFYTTFGISETRGLPTPLTLMDALNLGGGNYYALARHAVAALLNACHSGVDYPYTESEIISAVYNMFQNGTATLDGVTYSSANALKDALAAANELGCPLNNQNAVQSVTTRAAVTGELTLLASPNPFNSTINFNFVSPESGRATLEIFDLMGRKLANIFEGQVEKGAPKTIFYRVPQEYRVPMIYRLTMGSQTRFGKLLPGSTD